VSTTSKIEWTEKTWNPSTGCDRISTGCDNCYALTLAKRLKGMGQVKYQNDGDPRTSGPGFALTVHPDALDEPLRWRKPTKVFVNSMSDLFHARVPRDFLAEVFAIMALAPQHEFQVLTKRPERAARILGHREFRAAVQYAALKRAGYAAPWLVEPWWPLRNVWMGTSIESGAYVRRADALRAIPAAVRFISAEPLLGQLPSLNLSEIDWLILGGESGPGARPLDLGWLRELIAMAGDSGTAVFVKQIGSVWARQTSQILVDGPFVSAIDAPVSAVDTKGGKWEFWPDDLRIRQYPRVTEAVTR
jgi:protein gp37